MVDAMKAEGAFIGQDVLVTPLIGKLRLHIQGYVDREDFFISPLKHEDVIIGAPWFDRLVAPVKFPKRKISFKFREKDMYINAQESGSTISLVNDQAFDKSIKSLAFAYMIFVKDSLNGVNETQVNGNGMNVDLELSNFLNQFQDVFIDDIPGELPPKKGDDDHTIELILGSSPPNKPPYRISQAQQKEIMRQVNELVEKGMTIHGPTPSPNDGRDVDYELDGPSQDNLTLSSAGSNVDPENSSSLESDSMPTHFKPSTTLAVFVLIGAFFSIAILAMYTQLCTERNESTNDSAHQTLNFYSRGFLGSSLSFHSVVSQRHRSTSQFVTGLPTLQFPKDQALKESDKTITTQDFIADCVVCLNAFEEGEELRLLPSCRHSFHRDCIDKWLFSHATCPLCRRSIADNRKGECAVSAISAQPIMQSPL
ncbi:hypothetical protein L7F22_053606 [Adiantum nelumboides]|nr:hypothetical protein [Adiantum nelumboides]